MNNRKYFPFFASFLDAVERLDPEDQLAILLSIIRYALKDIEPTDLSPYCASMFDLIRPNLDHSKQRAEAGRRGGLKTASKRVAGSKQVVTDKEEEQDMEAEKDPEQDMDVEYTHRSSDLSTPMHNHELFDNLWDNYPAHRRVKRQEAIKAWDLLTDTQQTAAADNLQRWMASKQWSNDDGNYIPSITNYLDPDKGYLAQAPQAAATAADWDVQMALERMLNT